MSIYNQLITVRRFAAASLHGSPVWEIWHPELTVSLDERTLSVTVLQCERSWTFEHVSESVISVRSATTDARALVAGAFCEWRTGYAAGVEWALRVVDTRNGTVRAGVILRLWVDAATTEVGFELMPLPEVPDQIAAVNWPAPLVPAENRSASASVVPAMQGMMLPGDWPQPVNLDIGRLTYTRTLYMPWWGEVRGGAGMIAIIDTPYDAALTFDHAAGGPTHCGVQWIDSLGGLRYGRRILYQFFSSATHVTLAKAYRAYLTSRGRLVTLDEKVQRNPAVAKLIGTPVIHEALWCPAQPTSKKYTPGNAVANDGFTQSFDDLSARLKRLRGHGIIKAYVHIDGWGARGYDNLHPAPLPPSERVGGWRGLGRLSETCRELGYVLALHDQYRDYYEDSPDFNAAHAIMNADGGLPSDDMWLGGKQLILCASEALGYMRRNYCEIADHGLAIGGVYLDVFAIAELDQCFHPGHRMSRQQCAEHRADCMGYIRSRGMIVSSEEPADHAVPHLDLVHHAPYATYPKLGGGAATGIPVPLTSLVYHDCLLVPWEMKDDGGWGTPTGDAGWLHAMLNGGMPYLVIDAPAAHRELVHAVCELHRRVATLEMTSHELLDPAGRRQVSEFSDGTRVKVNFDTRQYTISGPRAGRNTSGSKA